MYRHPYNWGQPPPPGPRSQPQPQSSPWPQPPPRPQPQPQSSPWPQPPLRPQPPPRPQPQPQHPPWPQPQPQPQHPPRPQPQPQPQKLPQQPPLPQQPYPQHLNPNFSLRNQNPANSPYTYPPNPAFVPNHARNPYPNFPIQNPNFPVQNLNSLVQDPNFLVQNSTFTPQQLSTSSFQPRALSENPKPNVGPQQLPNSIFRPQSVSENPKEKVDPQHSTNSAFRDQCSFEDPKEILERMDRAVDKARYELVADGSNVSAWKVLQSALLMLKVDVWSSLGVEIHQVPSLHRLMLTEDRVNAYIHCFVGVRRIASLHDLELAICKNENIEKFEELGLGPLLRHPLVLHYFPVTSDTTEVCKITSEEIVFLLIIFEKNKQEVKDDSVEEFLDFIVKRRPVESKEKLGIRIYNLGSHNSSIRESRMLELSALKRAKKRLKQYSAETSGRKEPLILTGLKKRPDKKFRAISQQAKSFPVVHKDFCADEDRFVSPSSKHGGSKDYTHEEDDKNSDHVIGSQVKVSSKSAKISERVSSCTYLSAIEERSWFRYTHLSPLSGSQKHNDGNGSIKKKRKYENLGCPISAAIKLGRTRKRDRVDQDVATKNVSGTDEVSEYNLSIANELLMMFVTTWKEACREQSVAEVLRSMTRSY